MTGRPASDSSDRCSPGLPSTLSVNGLAWPRLRGGAAPARTGLCPPPRIAGAAERGPGPEPLENPVKLGGGNALAAVRDDHTGGRSVKIAQDRQPDRAAVGGVPDGVLEQGIHRQAEP